MLVEVSENRFVRKEDIVMVRVTPDELLLTSHVLIDGEIVIMSLAFSSSLSLYGHLNLLTN
jgi:hypothetical protein